MTQPANVRLITEATLGNLLANYNAGGWVEDLSDPDVLVAYDSESAGVDPNDPDVWVVGITSGDPGIRTYTANATLSTTNDNIAIGSGANLTITLPSAVVSGRGRQFEIKNTDSTNLTVASVAGTIDGASTKTLAQWEKAQYLSDGTNWLSV